MATFTESASMVLAAFRKRDPRRLRKLNDEILHTAALQFSPSYFNLAIFSYVLAKIVSKPRLLREEYTDNLRRIEIIFERVSRGARSEEEFLAIFSELGEAVAALEKEDPRFIVDLVTKGKLKMAATLYAQGMSLGTASEMTGMEKQEILDYAGETMMFDRLMVERNVLERMKYARKMIED